MDGKRMEIGKAMEMNGMAMDMVAALRVIPAQHVTKCVIKWGSNTFTLAISKFIVAVVVTHLYIYREREP